MFPQAEGPPPLRPLPFSALSLRPHLREAFLPQSPALSTYGGWPLLTPKLHEGIPRAQSPS